MTLVWFVIWFIADRLGDREALLLDPVNVCAGTFLLDLGRAAGVPGK